MLASVLAALGIGLISSAAAEAATRNCVGLDGPVTTSLDLSVRASNVGCQTARQTLNSFAARNGFNRKTLTGKVRKLKWRCTTSSKSKRAGQHAVTCRIGRTGIVTARWRKPARRPSRNPLAPPLPSPVHNGGGHGGDTSQPHVSHPPTPDRGGVPAGRATPPATPAPSPAPTPSPQPPSPQPTPQPEPSNPQPQPQPNPQPQPQPQPDNPPPPPDPVQPPPGPPPGPTQPPPPQPPGGIEDPTAGADAVSCEQLGGNGTGAPKASFGIAPHSSASGPAPHVVEFVNTSTGSFDACNWSFGTDGADRDGPLASAPGNPVDAFRNGPEDTDIEANPVYTFRFPGTYEVTLEVSGPNGSDTVTHTITVTGNKPHTAGTAEFVAYCTVIKREPNDPIVFPGMPGASHMHDFFGNRRVNAYSTTQQLLGGLETRETSCDPDVDAASYWIPTVYETGNFDADPELETREVTIDSPGPGGSSSGTFYYLARVNNPEDVRAFPQGFRMIAGDARAGSFNPTGGTYPFQPTRDIKWGCLGVNLPATSEMVHCPAGSKLELYVEFPDCWNGTDRDSPDHKSHVTYHGAGGVCPESHPIPIPWLEFKLQLPSLGGHDAVYDPDGPGAAMNLARNPQDFPADERTTDNNLWRLTSPVTAHGDFWNTWDQEELQERVANCLNKSVKCNPAGDVTG